MSETFAQYLDKWLKQSTVQSFSNPLKKMPIKRFRRLQTHELQMIANGGSMIIGTMSEPISRNLYKNSQTRIREQGEHCSFICYGAVEITLAAGGGHLLKTALFPIFIKRVSLQKHGDNIKVKVPDADDEKWQFNPILKTHLHDLNIEPQFDTSDNPEPSANWLKGQLGNRASVTNDSYVGLFSSQNMLVQQRLKEFALRRALANNVLIKAKIGGVRVETEVLGEVTDDGIEELGLVLPCDDSQLRVVQLSNIGCSMQVEGPPGTGKSQTITNIISNALFSGRNVLLVCDKKAAIVQVEERLTGCGLKPALLNLHDEDLDKREFLRQAVGKFETDGADRVTSERYPFEQLKVIRNTLNDRVKFGRTIAHPSLQVEKRQALSGMIRLRTELTNIPNVAIDNWQALSKERLAKLLSSLAQWPALSDILSDSSNVWNKVQTEAFDENPNAANELQTLVQKILDHLDTLDEVNEWAASLGVELPLQSDESVKAVSRLVKTVNRKPLCHPKLVGNSDVNLSELETLESVYKQRQALEKANHPVHLEQIYPIDEAELIIKEQKLMSWNDLSAMLDHNRQCHISIKERNDKYLQLCNQLGLVYSPLLKVRRSQLHIVLQISEFGKFIPRSWWIASNSPVLLVDGWLGKLRSCISHAKAAPFPLHFITLDNMALKNWQHVEAMAESGFNIVSYCLKYINDSKCKSALKQAYPNIPQGFKQWHEITLHAVTSYNTLKSLRLAAEESHVDLKALTENYLSVAHEAGDSANQQFVEHERVKALQKAAVLVEQCRSQNDLFEVAGIHWQTFWESPNQNIIAHAANLLREFDNIVLPDNNSDNLENAIAVFMQSIEQIQAFQQKYVKQTGDKSQSILKSFAAQKEYDYCQKALVPLEKYLKLQEDGQPKLSFPILREIIEWRDLFEQLCGQQRLDIDNKLWLKLHSRLQEHIDFMANAYNNLNIFFEDFLSAIVDYGSLREFLNQILQHLSHHHLWLEKKRWNRKIRAFPELKDIWDKILGGKVKPEHAERLFCYNMLRHCDPIAKPHGPELKQVLNSFSELDDKLSLWILKLLKSRLRESMQRADSDYASDEAELRRLSGLQRTKGTVRELLNKNIDYLLAAKPCWMMSPASLANLIDTSIFDKNDTPFDIVIFDEASQIHVLDGLLSMSFGRQNIIVGDKNQLPPTSFFTSVANDDDDAQDFGVSESLLDEFTGVFEVDKTHVMLMSHYRSETPDLIRFSNDKFYEGKLEVYPPARVSGIGRRLHYVPDAVYSETQGQRNNMKEADEVVKLIQLHVREFPGKSLGVVTMNISQMELIDEQLQFFQSDDVKAFCADDTKFFLRNLETVQGDEMDRIILSLTYGRNTSGKFNAAVLGPLTKNGGERRLNVALTRSRSGMTIVSSLKASDLEESGAQSKGFQCLKELLIELETTGQTRDYGIGNKRFERHNDGVSNIVYCESLFEEHVVDFLENKGYELECQYGVGKYRIDIVVKESGKNILAIECDGKAYHSSLNARTRDRARQRTLEAKGFRFHRVWSTNWWNYEPQEKEGIIAAIDAARNYNPPVYSISKSMMN
ncbi:MAG: AAA domain-containing protein [Nitrospirota bacterium]